MSEVKPLQMDHLDAFRHHYDEDVHTTSDMFAPTSAISRASSYPDPASAFISPASAGSPYDFNIPAFSEFTTRESRRGLLDHFCNVLSHLIVFKEDSGNPFRQLVLPMAQKSPPLLNAIYAISTAHLEHRGLQVEEKALDLHSKALQGLANLIAHKDEGNRDEVLAVIILLLYYEVGTSLESLGRSIIDRLPGGTKWIFHCFEQPSQRGIINYAGKESEAWPCEHISGAGMQSYHRYADPRLTMTRHSVTLMSLALCPLARPRCPVPSSLQLRMTSSTSTNPPPSPPSTPSLVWWPICGPSSIVSQASLM